MEQIKQKLVGWIHLLRSVEHENTQGECERAESTNSGDVVARVNPLLYTPNQRWLQQGLKLVGLFLPYKLTCKRTKQFIASQTRKIKQMGDSLLFTKTTVALDTRENAPWIWRTLLNGNNRPQ